MWELCQGLSESVHALGELTTFVLGNRQLYVAEYKVPVQLSRFDIVVCRIVELVHDEQNCQNGG